MKKKDGIALNIILDSALHAKVDHWRYTRRYATRTEAIEALLRHVLKLNPTRDEVEGRRKEGEA